MAVVERNLRMTVEEFDQFVDLPENADKLFEYFGGEIVEVLSPGNTPHEMRIKIANYLNDSVVVWVVDYETKTVEVYTPCQKAVVLTEKDTLDGGAVLPGFTLAVKDVFPAEPPAESEPTSSES
jgi:hypothetical protein